jgi:SOS-response transcriptional repressor LexA
MTLGEKLRSAREARGLTLEQVAQALRVSRQSVHFWETDETRPRHKRIEEIAELYQVDKSWLLLDNAEPTQPLSRAPEQAQQQRAVPVINFVQAGAWTGVAEDVGGGEVVVTDLPVGPRAFALIVKGLSMVPAMHPQDKVVVDPDVTPRPGALVVAQIEGEAEATLKRYRDRGRDADGKPIIELAPENPDYPTLRIDATTPGRIVGVVVEHRSYPGPGPSA